MKKRIKSKLNGAIRTLSNQKGFGLIEFIVVMALTGIVTFMLAPTIIEGMNKQKANSLRDELTTLVSSVATIDSQGSSVHAVKVDVKTAGGNQSLMKDYIVTVAPSTAFQTVTSSEPFRPDASGVPLKLDFGLNTITVTSPAGHTGTAKHTGSLTSAPVEFGTAIVAPELGTQGSVGIGPLFNISETKLHEDFILSPNGLNLAEFDSYIADDTKLLAALLGGTIDSATPTKYSPYTAPSTTTYAKAPIELTKVDIETFKASSSGVKLKTLSNPSKGALYMVTGFMSQADFLAKMATDTSVYTGGTVPPVDVLTKMYDTLRQGFSAGTLVYIPYREKDIVKSTESDLKYGLYR